MPEDYSHARSSTEGRSDGRPQPYADTSLPYMEQPSSSFYERSSASVQQPELLTEEAKLAADYQLGNVRKRYKSEPTAFTTEVLSSIPVYTLRRMSRDRPGCPLMVLLILLPAALVILAIARSTPWLLILISVLVLAPWLSNVFGRLPEDIIAALQNTRFYLCTNGLMIIKWTRVQALRWEHIQAIQHLQTQNVRHPYYILYPYKGKPITLNRSLAGDEIKELGETIEHEISQRLIPDAIADYEAGQVLDFGAINVTAQGLMLADEQRSLPWDRFASIEYYNGHYFTIKERATSVTWQKIEVEDMLNFCVFLPLIAHIKSGLQANADESADATINETTEKEAAQSYDAYHDFGFKEQPSVQGEDLERMKRAQAEILKRLRSSRRVTSIPAEVIEALHTLDLPSDASLDVIHQQYRHLAKRYHPDAGGDPETFKQINAAYKCVTTWITSQDQGNT